MSLRVVHLFQVGLVRDRLYSFLQRNDLVIARNDSHGAKLEALGQVHGADGHLASRDLKPVIEESNERAWAKNRRVEFTILDEGANIDSGGQEMKLPTE